MLEPFYFLPPLLPLVLCRVMSILFTYFARFCLYLQLLDRLLIVINSVLIIIASLHSFVIVHLLSYHSFRYVINISCSQSRSIFISFFVDIRFTRFVLKLMAENVRTRLAKRGSHQPNKMYVSTSKQCYASYPFYTHRLSLERIKSQSSSLLNGASLCSLLSARISSIRP